VKDKPALPY